MNSFLECEHLVALEIAGTSPPLVDNPQADLIRRKGDEHEAAYLASLRVAGKTVVEPDDAEDAARLIREATADVIYQPEVEDPAGWRGRADFLELQTGGTYEVVDTKLARHAKPGHVFQLCFYSSAVGGIQGRQPERMHLVLGDGRRESFRLDEYDAYYRRIRDRFVDFADAGANGTSPYPVGHCSICVWKERCTKEWERGDHLSLVANMRRAQVERLVTADITTLQQLAETPPTTAVKGIPDDTLEALRDQAALQLHHRRTGEHKLTQLPPQERRGFALLPPPARGDVYYDIEGDPFYSPAGSLEYLHGVTYLDDANELCFRAFWAEREEDEKRAFEQLVEFLVERRRRYPEMHVYHYANYERAALQRLMQKHGTREDEVDDLLRGEVLVDLFQVVRQALRISLPSYSLKKVETLYFPERDTEVSGGEDSTVAFERFLETGDRSLLAGIEAYNRDDCGSTFGLHWWLVGLRPDIPWAEPPERREPKPEAAERRTERELVQTRLRERGETLLADLLDFHRLDAKPAWWDYFRRLELDERELIEDPVAIGGIEPTDVLPVQVKQSLVYELCFPAQEFKVGSEALDPETRKSPGTILAIDETTGRIRLRRSRKRHDEPLPRALVPPEPLPNWEQRDALLRLGRAILDGGDDHRAARAILARERPRARLDAGVTDAASSLDSSYLFVQGPPGTGKTWRGAEAGVALMQAGQRVGVAAQSHKAINKFLEDVVAHAQRAGYEFRGVKKTSDYEGTRFEGSDLVENVSDAKSVSAGDHQLVGATAWQFAREDMRVDTLLIDEAGQMALADALAMATSARNVVLLGDPNQLPQVSQGALPPEVRASVLEHLLDEPTVRADRGVF
ncbi:MAG: TM0106 family RecB-like putative nuclease, partial [Gaiellaceae bacterium]